MTAGMRYVKGTFRLWIFTLMMGCCVGTLLAQDAASSAPLPLSLASVFTDNMVLQARQSIYVWGMGQPGTVVYASLGSKNKKTKVKDDSTWIMKFPKRKHSFDPVILEVASEGKVIQCNNILIGEVWLCAGQTNMGFEMKDEDYASEEVATAEMPNVRFFVPNCVGNGYPVRRKFPKGTKDSLARGLFCKGKWFASTPKNLSTQPAIAHYVAKTLQQTLNEPVGIVNIAITGSPIETWLSADALSSTRKLAKKLRGNWLFNADLSTWARRTGAYNLTGTGEPASVNMKNLAHPFKPTYVYDNFITRIRYLGIKGVLFYQGETNSETLKRSTEYGELMHLLVQDYRFAFRQKKLPFYWVQLPSIETATYANADFWPIFRNEQRLAAQRIKKNAGLVPSYDILASNAVPTNKRLVADRLAALVLEKVYKKKTNLSPPAPEPIRATFDKKEGITIDFKNTGKGLGTSGSDVDVRGFSVDGTQEVQAKILKSNSILIETTRKPKFVFYAWEPNSEIANLVNSASVPALAFKIKVN